MDEIPQQPVTVAEVARVGIDLPCISCGYNLRSLPMSGRCPECNSSIESALHHGWLMFADPQWLRRLRSGVTLILWTLLASVICYVGMIIIVIAFFVPSGGPPELWFIQVPMIVVGLGLWAAWLISVIRLTSPEPGGRAGGGIRRGTLAKWIVALTVAPALSMLISGFSYDTMMTSPELPLFDTWLVSKLILSYIASLSGMVGFFLLLIVMRRIARRHTAKGLGKLMTVMIWGSAALGVGWTAAMLAMMGIGLSAFNTGAMAATTTSAPAGLAALGYTSPPIATSQWATYFSVGPNVSTPPAVTTTGPVTSRPTTGPATTMPAPPAAPPMPAFLTSGWMFPGILLLLIIEFGTFGWMICGLVALFWFRSVFGGAIARNAAHPLGSAA